MGASMYLLIVVASLFLLLGFILLLLLPPIIDRHFNRVIGAPPDLSQRVRELHRSLLIIDLHADSLLWNRDLLIRNTRGHIDIPRLVEGNVALQVFTIVTKVPSHVNIEQNSSETDDITLLAMAQRWPVSTWTSLKQRAIYQAEKLNQTASQSDGRLTIIKTSADLDRYLRRRQNDQSMTAGILGVEGAHCLEGDLENLQVLFEHGIRIIAPTHFFDNEIGGSAHGLAKGGLTEKGREMIRRMQAMSVILDLAHGSLQLFDDALEISTKPVIVSHGGVIGTCANSRNLSDDQMRGVAKTGGIIGIGYWREAVCGVDALSIARAIRYTADLVGVEHVSLGSDFDGAVSTPFDTASLATLTDALLDLDFTENEIRLIMGMNAIRVLSMGLPAV